MVSLPLFQIQLYSLSAMHPEKYTLSWHSYTAHLKRMMKELMMNEDYSDVTLVTEDKKHIKANINILSACSPVFRDILKKENVASTIIYLRGIQFSEMESIMHYVYIGEATFHEERMNEFLSVAKLLEIKELCNTEPEKNEVPFDKPLPTRETISEDLRPTAKFDYPNNLGQQKNTNGHKTYSAPGALNNHKQSSHQGAKYACDQCDYQTTTQSSLSRHRESQHEDVKYACDQCDYQAKRQDNLTVHIQSKHEGVKYLCEQCDYQAKWKSDLTIHIQSKHEGFKYACGKCDYQATQRGDLTEHIKTKHEGVKYACNQCDYQALHRRNLNVHIKSKHDGIKYDCDQCDYQATQQANLITHIKKRHNFF